MNTHQPWNAIFTRPNTEKKVSRLLEKKGIVHYCPQNRVTVDGYTEEKTVATPLFPSLIFIQAPATRPLSALRQLPNVVNIAYWQQQPAAFPAGEIDSLRRFMEAYETVQVVKQAVRHTPYATGQEPAAPTCFSTDKMYSLHLPTIGYSLSAKTSLVTNVKLVKSAAPANRAADGLALILGFKINSSKFE